MKDKYIAALFFCLSQITYAQIPIMMDGWPYLTQTDNKPVYVTPRFSIGSRFENNAIYFNNVTGDIDKFQFSQNQFAGWPILADTVLFYLTSPILLDLDHDSLIECVTSGWPIGRQRSDMLFVIDDNGAIFESYPRLYENDPRSLNIADFDNDGEYEIIRITQTDRLINCVDIFGNSKPGWPVNLPDDYNEAIYMGSGAAVGDLDLDGNNEYLIMGYFHIYAYRYDGTMQAGFPIAIQDTTFEFSNGNAWPPTLADVDTDSYLEILVSGDNWVGGFPPRFISFVSIYENTGELKPSWPIYYYDQLISNAPIPADIDNNGSIEIGFQAHDLYFLDINGNPLPGWPVAVTDPLGRHVGTVSDFIIFDIDGDGNSEIFLDNGSIYVDSIYQDTIAIGAHGYIYGFDHIGQVLPGWPLRVKGDTFSRPLSFGYDSVNFRSYMAIFSRMYLNYPAPLLVDSAFIEAYIFSDSNGNSGQWPMMSHDDLQTRNYNFVDNVTTINERREFIPKSYALRQNYPNPFNARTVISYSLPKSGDISIDIFDILGRKVATLIDGIEKAGNHEVTWDAEDFPSGVYFVKLKADDFEKSIKIVLMK